MSGSILIDTGDYVHHGPTGEDWVVACVQGDKLSWCGWPEGMAELSDCTLLKKASPEERDKLLRHLAASAGNDHRARHARRLLDARGIVTRMGGDPQGLRSEGLEPGPQDAPESTANPTGEPKQ